MKPARMILALLLVPAIVAGLTMAKGDLVGTTAPEFTLKDVNGKEFSLADYKGKIVVLEWANKDCPVWVGVLKTLNDTYKDSVDKDVVWLNIDSTNYAKADDVRKYMIKNDVTKPWLLDPDGKVGHAYSARTTPHMFIIDKDGKVAYDGAIDNKKSGDDYVNYVAKALEELLAGKAVTTPKTNPYGCSVKYKK